MRILVCGSREWTNRKFIAKILKEYEAENPIVVHGACPDGADIMADWEAKCLGYAVDPYPADWNKYGRRAGYVRNARMLEEGKPDLALAFQVQNSPGTTDMINRLREANVPVRVFRVQNKGSKRTVSELGRFLAENNFFQEPVSFHIPSCRQFAGEKALALMQFLDY